MLLRPVKRLGRQLFKWVGNSRWNRQQIMRRLEEIDRVQMGSGPYYFPHWLNITLLSGYLAHPYGALQKVGDAYVLHFDLTRPMPIRDGTMRYVYSSHFVEHLTQEQGRAFFRECYRIMQTGGIIRTVCPDLEAWIRKYAANDTAFFDLYYKICGPILPVLKTKGEMFNSQMHAWGHNWIYDFEMMKVVLEDIGFREVTRQAPFESVIPDIDKLEHVDEIRQQESLFVEARKP